MDVERFGIILTVAHFDDCVSFYQSLFGLKELFSKRDGDFRLTCLGFGDAYLMIETGGVASPQEKNLARSPAILRFHVADTLTALPLVQSYDPAARRYETDWGNIIRCVDPDGNPISIRESRGFELQ
ncbi:VOC family protein [Planctobacterium marinum]|uniref:Glyoxalase n=1 Tax=Planctobacterium marinum TaxID=1631968 RepID=A0AA48HR13_9ALTE|nr:glyoxalase [Planctobacterium marinum]